MDETTISMYIYVHILLPDGMLEKAVDTNKL